MLLVARVDDRGAMRILYVFTSASEIVRLVLVADCAFLIQNYLRYCYTLRSGSMVSCSCICLTLQALK